MDIETLASILASIATVILAVTAIWALGQWRRELNGRAKVELARKVIHLSLKFNSAFEYVRFFATTEDEYIGRPRPDKPETPDEKHMRDQRYALFQRLEKSRQLLVELQECSWEAEAVFDESLDKFLEPYFKASREVQVAIIAAYSENIKGQSMKDYTEIIYSSGNDEIAQSVKAATDKLKTHMKRYLK